MSDKKNEDKKEQKDGKVKVKSVKNKEKLALALKRNIERRKNNNKN